ncbi:MAG TPA: hypothetical protein VIL48_09385 [Acidimicrobiales bacterium]
MDTQHRSSSIPPCETCGGPRVGDLYLTGQAVGVHPRKQNLWHRPMSRANVVACLNCGELRLYAQDLDKLRRTTQEHPDWFTR